MKHIQYTFSVATSGQGLIDVTSEVAAWPTAQGADDMPAHIKAALTQSHLSIPVRDGRMQLGTWQGIYVFEHRASPHQRELVLHFLGE